MNAKSACKPATPLPWHVGIKQAEQIVYDKTGWAVANATVYHGHSDAADAKANAQYLTHAANAYPELVAALRMYQAAFETVHPITGEVFCEFLPSITPVVKDTRALLAKLGEG